MRTVTYTKSYFVAPNRISQDMYHSLKSELRQDPSFKIDKNSKTFSEHFNISLTILKIAIVTIVFCLVLSMGLKIDEKGSFLAFPAGVSVLAIIPCTIHLLTEGPSYATYIKNRDEYFARMKYAILNTSDYKEFTTTFYH